MRYLLLLCASVFWLPVAQAFDVSTQSLVVSGYVTSKVTTAPFDQKLMIDARDDAAAFVASQGHERGALLEAALSALRRQHPRMQASDLELAQAILVQ